MHIRKYLFVNPSIVNVSSRQALEISQSVSTQDVMEGLARMSDDRRFEEIGYKTKVVFTVTSQNRVLGIQFVWACENSCSDYLRYLSILEETRNAGGGKRRVAFELFIVIS